MKQQNFHFFSFIVYFQLAVIAQLGERQTEDLKVPGSIPGRGIFLFVNYYDFLSKKIDVEY